MLEARGVKLRMRWALNLRRELSVIVGNNSNWFMIFEFEDTGYLKDEEGSKLNSSAILKSIQDGTETSNEQRAGPVDAGFILTACTRRPPEANPIDKIMPFAR